MSTESDKLEAFANQIADSSDTDVLLYAGGIDIMSARQLVALVGSREARKKNLYFILGTVGGDARAAYKIARCLQHAYEDGTFSIAVYGECKSAGTLIALAAHRLVLCQHGELGPLDVQLKKDDQLFVRSSGLTTTQALESLKTEAFSQFEHFLLEIHQRTGYEISTRLATSMAIRLVSGLLGPIYQQIDPLRIGETQRAMDVAQAYGSRLSKNLQPSGLNRLIREYPSHDFSIDFDEAKSLFKNVRRPSDLERELGNCLAHLLLDYSTIAQSSALIVYLNSVPEPKPDGINNENQEHGEDNESHPTASRPGEPSPARDAGGSSAAAANGGGGGNQVNVKVARSGAKAASSNGRKVTPPA